MHILKVYLGIIRNIVMKVSKYTNWAFISLKLYYLQVQCFETDFKYTTSAHQVELRALNFITREV